MLQISASKLFLWFLTSEWLMKSGRYFSCLLFLYGQSLMLVLFFSERACMDLSVYRQMNNRWDVREKTLQKLCCSGRPKDKLQVVEEF